MTDQQALELIAEMKASRTYQLCHQDIYDTANVFEECTGETKYNQAVSRCEGHIAGWNDD